MAGRKYPFPFRTRKSSAPAPMILPTGGKVGRRRLFLFFSMRAPLSIRTAGRALFFPQGGSMSLPPPCCVLLSLVSFVFCWAGGSGVFPCPGGRRLARRPGQLQLQPQPRVLLGELLGPCPLEQEPLRVREASRPCNEVRELRPVLARPLVELVVPPLSA